MSFPILQMVISHHVAILKVQNFNLNGGSGGPRHVIMQNFVTTGQSIANILQYFDFSRSQRPPPSWISLEHTWTTHGEYSAVSITLQNLVMIDAVVLIKWTFQYLVHLAGNAYSRSHNWSFWAIWSPKTERPRQQMIIRWRALSRVNRTFRLICG